jgi:hypothetical protein
MRGAWGARQDLGGQSSLGYEQSDARRVPSASLHIGLALRPGRRTRRDPNVIPTPGHVSPISLSSGVERRYRVTRAVLDKDGSSMHNQGPKYAPTVALY